MKITVEFKDGVQATVDDGVWTCESPEIAKKLNDMTPVSAQRLGYWPHPNWMLVDPVVEEMGAKVVSYDKIEYDPNVIY
jgi:hypothetical protein